MAAPRAVNMAAGGINFLDLDIYTSGGGIPEGDWALFFNVQFFKGTGANAGPERLGAMITAYALNDPSEEAKRTGFYSFGTGADKSWAPNPETGKGVIAVPGGAPFSPNLSTNWAILLKSLYDCGLPKGIALSDFSVIDGIHVHMTPIPEPEERKSFGGAATGEAANMPRVNKTISVVTEIKEDGKPWEGTGGMPKAKTGTTKPVTVTPGRERQTITSADVGKMPAGVIPQTQGISDEDLRAVAQSAFAAVLEKHTAKGCPKLMLKTSAFSAIKTVSGDDVAQAIIDKFFASDDALNGVIGELGFVAAGPTIKPAGK